MNIYQEKLVRPNIEDPEYRVLLMISLIILLAGSFTMQYVGQTYFSEDFLDFFSPGFWMLIGNGLFTFGIMFLNKRALGWSWGMLGLSRPRTWWEPLVVIIAILAAVFLIVLLIQPIFRQWSTNPNIDHLMVINKNLPLFFIVLALVWINSAIISNLVFKAFLINSLDILLGRNQWSPWVAMVLSSFIFGLMHAWQGLGGILTTASIGLVFGTAFLLNNRRIWAIIFAHGIIDMISLWGIYSM